MNEPSGRSRNRPQTHLLHARPRLMFHLGHLRMLNHLYRILVEGDNVILLLIPYDEHEKRNKTIRIRLGEEIELTKGFYRNYLGFDRPRLQIISTRELDLAQERLTEIQDLYSALYDRGAPAVRRLIDEQNRPWASPNIQFVAKCLAAVEQLDPDRLVCGEKHRAIAECFDEVLRALDIDIPFETFENFPDLFMEAGMDRTDSVHSYIDVNDNEDFVLHKLSSLRDLPGRRSEWLQAFMKHIFDPAPERVKNGLNRVHRSETEREMALTKLLAGARALIPYSMDDGDDDVQIIWHWNISSISFSERPRIERIARQLFQGEKAARIVLYREFGGGKSGATVLEVREHEEHDELRVSNVSILKVGQEHELHQEQDNYERLVKNRGTAAFMTIKRGGVSIGGVAGIVYQDAQHYLGIRRQERIDDVSALFRPVQDDLEMARERLDRLLVAHLHEVLYKHGARVDAGSLRPYVNEFLPAEYRVEVSRYEPDGEVIACAAGDAAEERLSAEVDVAEVDLGLRVARAYRCDDRAKIDLLLTGADEILLNEVTPGRRLRVEGRIAATRRDFYDSLLPRLGVTRRGRFLWVDGARVGDPAGRTDEFLRREHYSFVMSPVHGDLHAGNVLLGGDGFGIIDYGRMRARFPALYDIAYLYADLKSRFVADRFDIPTLVSLEESILYGARRPRIRRHRGDARQLELFEYGALPEEIRLLGSPATYYSLLGLILLGRLKFDVPEVEKRAGLVLAHYAFERAR
ncbi:phosphotransferase [Actinomadura viridis]|uniref:phosphotransferase n=1 Tax=Actinomadura viridis TaxID=58110 RepID=UPI0036BF77AB